MAVAAALVGPRGIVVVGEVVEVEVVEVGVVAVEVVRVAVVGERSDQFTVRVFRRRSCSRRSVVGRTI